jgi:leucine dehydrogenase
MPDTLTLRPEDTGAVFSHPAFAGHEQVVFGHDAETGLRAIVAVHSTVLGPALGGCRYFPYRDDAEALRDVLRLSEGMTAKSALAGLDLGGGKAVIIGRPRVDRTEALMRAFGRLVARLGGRYITAEDVGTTEADMDVVREETEHVVGLSPERGGVGDPSPATALGVFVAMEAVARHRWGDGSLAGRHVAISGVGKVGGSLAARLAEAGARLTIADVDHEAADRVAAATGAAVVAPQRIGEVECDIFAPCALGGILDAATIPRLRCAAVVGAANNQLADVAAGELLSRAGIVYAPDYLVNAGGIIHVAAELDGSLARVDGRVRAIGDTVGAVLTKAKVDGVTTAEAAGRLARARLARRGRD